MKAQFHKLLLLAFAVPIILSSCKKSDESADDKFSSANDVQLKTDLVYCGTPVVSPMVDFAQTISPATVSIGNDETQLLVKYQITDTEWFLYNPRLFVGTEAELVTLGIVDPNSLNPDGSVYINNTGLIPNSSFNGSSTVYKEFLFDLATLPECFVVIAYAELRKTTGERAYVFGKSTMKRNGYYLNYCVQQCETPPPPPPLGGCETAYAFGESVATCFLNIPGVQSNNWGWSNGPIGAGTYSWPMYAGAGQCNIGNGTHVGTLTVNYTPPTATVTYTVFNGYVLNETHLHVGNQILPRRGNRFTTAPGQFPYKRENLNGVTTDTYNISGLSGNIYVAAHSVVCDAQ
ncbi:MAG: hypothetical protein FD170_756 [Bacteroidetes bacterium]|nr:MAG: hypothetical protein FD170_756 [Bacteroidota bacterium]